MMSCLNHQYLTCISRLSLWSRVNSLFYNNTVNFDGFSHTFIDDTSQYPEVFPFLFQDKRHSLLEMFNVFCVFRFCQKCSIPSISASFALGFTHTLKWFSAHGYRFSIMLRSVFGQKFILFFSLKLMLSLLLCFRSLSH